MYVSTRGKERVSASYAIIKGLASDGGLFVPEEIKKIDFNEDLLKLSYNDLAFIIFKSFLDDFSDYEIKEVIAKAYNDEFFNGGIVGGEFYDAVSFLDLYHGPTFAFKDVALTVLPHLLEKALKKNNNTKTTVILTATSGDTGSASMSGFSQTNIKTIVLYPNDGVSRLQEAQMHSFSKDESIALALNGNFDDCQKIVKEVFEKVEINGVNLASANSINIGRLIPQIVYYFYHYLECVRRGKIKFKEPINYVVPTGNFGNILAGFYAKMMGVPINVLVCASNKNNVLTDFFNSGQYNKNREFYKTMSPSMDILISSNLERYLYYLLKENSNEVKRLMEELKEYGQYDIKDVLRKNNKDIISNYTNEEETLEAIKEVYEKYNLLIDPHTAVSYGAYKKSKIKGYTAIVSTASPFKFVNVYKDLFKLSETNEFNQMRELAKKTDTLIDQRILKLEEVKIDRKVINKEDCINKIKEIVGAL